MTKETVELPWLDGVSMSVPADDHKTALEKSKDVSKTRGDFAVQYIIKPRERMSVYKKND